MTKPEQYANNAQTTLNGAIATTPAAGTSEAWTVASTAGRFPTIPQFHAVITPSSGTDADPEIVLVTTINDGTHFQVERGAEGSTIKVHSSGDFLTLVITEESLRTITNPGRVYAWANFK